MCIFSTPESPATASSSFCNRNKTQSCKPTKLSSMVSDIASSCFSAQVIKTLSLWAYVNRSASNACWKSTNMGGATSGWGEVAFGSGDARPLALAFALALGSTSGSASSAAAGTLYSESFHAATSACFMSSTRNGNSQCAGVSPSDASIFLRNRSARATLGSCGIGSSSFLPLGGGFLAPPFASGGGSSVFSPRASITGGGGRAPGRPMPMAPQ
mmetsp:Transcript_82308/g.229366  ORF Transcript_82308/g.229366 Transcript_82308/m.229366 type:complete len:214 (-) Transcript_82308:965-1606(-)